MEKLFVVCVLVVVAAAQDQAQENKVEIITERSFVRTDGYDFEFKTSDGTSRKEQADLITVGDHQGIGVRGSYSYTAPDGQQYEVTFVANEKGFQPQIKIVNSSQ
ncbi:endocuticle structural glycoprotein SgAbd-5-like [Leptidea sinapis]|uniref:endocuticle structural glycoprotein SgAbd-5-like n=1 Tax=Leptidea sinapis TaxID=189913 RepID=UPI0021C2BD3E|nr:endocuticle structural glycoprotein SgAbd-5-like [Leptidea sinapis]